MKNITKKQDKYFREQVEKIVKKFNGIDNENRFKDIFHQSWTVDTIYGTLNISLHENAGYSIYSIFMRFDDAESAKDHVDCNPYSGKWNIHSSDIAYTLEDFEDRLKKVTTPVTNPVTQTTQPTQKIVEKRIKTFEKFVNEDFELPGKPNNKPLPLKVGDILECKWDGKVSISQGDDARSAEVVRGDKFIVKDVDRNPYWVFGELQIKGKFVRSPNLSGKDPDELKKIPIPSDVEYAIMRDHIDKKYSEPDFWAFWQTYWFEESNENVGISGGDKEWDELYDDAQEEPLKSIIKKSLVKVYKDKKVIGLVGEQFYWSDGSNGIISFDNFDHYLTDIGYKVYADKGLDYIEDIELLKKYILYAYAASEDSARQNIVDKYKDHTYNPDDDFSW